MKQLTVKNIRLNNKENILKEIISSNGITRNDLSKLTNVSLMTITNIVDELLYNELVFEKKSTSSIGRIPSLLYLNDNAYSILVLDLSLFDEINFAIFKLKGELIYEDTFTIPSTATYEKALKNLSENIINTISKMKLNIVGVGVSVPGVYDKEKDIIKSNLIESLGYIRPKKLLSDLFKTDNIVIQHDVIAAAYAEQSKLKDATSMLYLYIGDGLGGSFINSGTLIKGYTDVAMEIGQVKTLTGERYEEKISLKHLTKKIPKTLNKYTLTEIFKKFLYEENDEISEFVNGVLKATDIIVYNLLWLYNPQYLIINSSNKQLPPLIVDSADKYIQKNIKELSGFDVDYNILVSSYGTKSSLMGLKDEVLSKWIHQVI